MKRILLLITDLEIGGTPTVVRELALRLTAGGGVHVEVACLSPWGPVADQISAANIRVSALDAESSTHLPAVIGRLLRVIRARKIDTVFSFLVHANAVAAATSVMCRGVRFLQSIQTTQPSPRWHWPVQAVAQNCAKLIVVPSASVARVAQKWARVPAERIVVIPNAVNMAEFCGTSDSIAPRVGRHIGFIGRLDPVKRVVDLLEAVRLMTEAGKPTSAADDINSAGFSLRLVPDTSESSGETKHPQSRTRGLFRDGPLVLAPSEPADFRNTPAKAESARIHLHIFGDGAERANIERAIGHRSLGSCVTLHGAIPRAQEALAQIDLLVLPSDSEGFGLVLIEAMAAGIPVVATNVPGIRDVVRDGETGILVPARSPAKLAAAIEAVLEDADGSAAMTVRAREDVRSRFSWDNVLPQYQRVLGISA